MTSYGYLLQLSYNKHSYIVHTLNPILQLYNNIIVDMYNYIVNTEGQSNEHLLTYYLMRHHMKPTIKFTKNKCFLFFNGAFCHQNDIKVHGSLSAYIAYLESINCNFTANKLKYALITL